MLNSNSQASLLAIITKFNTNVEEANNTVSYVKYICDRDTLDFNLAVEEIISVIEKTPDIKNINAFVKGVAKRLSSSTVKKSNKIEYVPNTQIFINELRNTGVKVLSEESTWVYVVWKHLLNMKDIDLPKCIALNHKILDFMVKSQKMEFKDYKELLMNSNALKPYAVNWDLLEAKTELLINEWKEKVAKVESIE